MRTRRCLSAIAALSVVFVTIGGARSAAQQVATKAPTAADWAAVAKLPDLTGVWEARGGGGNAKGSSGPQLTPPYAAKLKAFQAAPPEDSETANCLPPGMPRIMTQPYPMEFLLTPGRSRSSSRPTRRCATSTPMAVRCPRIRIRIPWHIRRPLGGRGAGGRTIGFSPLTDIARDVPHSDKMRIVERFPLTGPDTMSDRDDRHRSGRAHRSVHDDADTGATSRLDNRRVHL